MSYEQQILALESEWKTSLRWKGITRNFTAADIVRLRGSVRIQHTLAEMGARRLWHLLETEPFVRSLGAMSGNQAVEMVAAGLQAIYVSGWQVAGDANDSLQMYPDQSLYSVSSVPTLIKRINNALQRADQIHHMQGGGNTHWFAPLVADAEAGFGGTLNVFELVKAMIEAGLPSNKVSAASFGEGHPTGSNSTKEGRAQNRRIEITIGPDLSALPGCEEQRLSRCSREFSSAAAPDAGRSR